VLGPYVIHERLGVGGMAAVHRAERRGIEGFRRQVALKRLHAHVADDPAMVSAFVHEAQLASRLHHTNVAQTYDLGKVNDTYFIAMEYVEGPTLTQVMRQCAAAAGAMPVPIVLSILMQVCDALDHAHNLTDDAGQPLGIIHRDVSPSNIIVSNTGIVKLIDFGIAKAASQRVKTMTGLVKGKFAYLAPEYTRGQLDLRADLFGLGVIAHELLTARSLFQAKNDFETITRLRELQIQPPSRHNPEISRDVDDIVMTALQRDPTLRWQSAAAMRVAITNAARAVGVVAGTQEVREWTEWALAQPKRQRDPTLDLVIDMLGEPTSEAIELSEDQLAQLESLGDPLRAPPSDAPVAERTGAESGVVLAPPSKRDERGRGPWLGVLVLLLLLAGGAVAGYCLGNGF
jgi:serine/threonine protein kinase